MGLLTQCSHHCCEDEDVGGGGIRHKTRGRCGAVGVHYLLSLFYQLCIIISTRSIIIINGRTPP